MHGTNDAQKTMGIIALALVAATKAGHVRTSARLALLPAHPGAAAGQRNGNRSVDQGGLCADHGLGHCGRRLAYHQDPGSQNGEAASDQWFCCRNQFRSVILVATHLGIPVSTTHDISAAIMGVGPPTPQRRQMDRRRANGVGLDPDDPSHRLAGLRLRAIVAGLECGPTSYLMRQGISYQLRDPFWHASVAEIRTSRSGLTATDCSAGSGSTGVYPGCCRRCRACC